MEEGSKKYNITIPAELYPALDRYRDLHPEFNFSGFVQGKVRELLLTQKTV